MRSSIGIKQHNICPPHLINFLKKFFSLSEWKGLYLTGGTALSEYYLGHRSSVDIDLFTNAEELFRSAISIFQDKKIWKQEQIKVMRSFPRFVSALIHFPAGEPVKLDLVHDIPVRLGEPVQFDKIWIDDLPDIASNKITCLISRQEIKDFVDIYFLFPELGWNVEKWVENGNKKDGGLAPFILSSCIEWIYQVEAIPHFMKKTINWGDFHKFWQKFQKDLMELEPRPAI